MTFAFREDTPRVEGNSIMVKFSITGAKSIDCILDSREPVDCEFIVKVLSVFLHQKLTLNTNVSQQIMFIINNQSSWLISYTQVHHLPLLGLSVIQTCQSVVESLLISNLKCMVLTTL